MFREIGAAFGGRRVFVLSLITIVTAVSFTTDSADARRRYRHNRHHARVVYNPPFASIIVDANSGSVLQSTNPDALRHPASLTKIMTLYMLFERLEQGKIRLDSQMEVSEHASEQAPTKLGLRPGQSIAVEDAIKGLVTRSANDAAVVIAETLGGEEDDFAKMMTRKARALGMSKTVYRNASGLPDSEQVTTARDQAILGRAIQDRFPKYYRFFATNAFHYRGNVIRNHNRLLGKVEGVDGIKTGYTRASGFNLVTSMKRGNRHLVGVVLGGRSGGSRDAIMRNLLAENLEKGATRRTVAAITDRDMPEGAAAEPKVASTAPAAPAAPPQAMRSYASAAPNFDGDSRPPAPIAAPQVASAASEPITIPTAAQPTQTQMQRPMPLTNGVIAQPMAAIPGSSEPMTPVRVRTVQVKSSSTKTANAAPVQVASAAPAARTTEPEVTTRSIGSSEIAKTEPARTLPPQPAGHGTGRGILGTLPASGTAPHSSAMAYAAPAQQPQADKASAKPVARSGWIIQVGALESEAEARKRIEAARERASALTKAESFTETVEKGDRRLYRARFAGLDRDKAEAVCKTLKRSDISCIAIKN
jgi:D-alanyl-D-alanine carboxypeptidase